MEHLDKLIPLAILGLVAAILVVLLRRAAREQPTLPVETPPVMHAEPAAPVAPEPIVSPPPALEITKPTVQAVKQRTKRKRPPIPATLAPEPTPIAAVLDLLKKKDSLAAAFLLREILAPPVSKRH